MGFGCAGNLALSIIIKSKVKEHFPNKLKRLFGILMGKVIRWLISS